MLFSETFPHRHNKDGSFDSICPSCLMTVASVEKESQLAALESSHICDPDMRYRIEEGRMRILEGKADGNSRL